MGRLVSGEPRVSNAYANQPAKPSVTPQSGPRDPKSGPNFDPEIGGTKSGVSANFKNFHNGDPNFDP